jgi:rubrerythrin
MTLVSIGELHYMIEQLKKEGLFLSSGSFNPSFVKKFNNTLTPERKIWYDSLLGSTLSEKVYILKNDLKEIPVCKLCDSPVKFISYKEGYREYCSSKCRAKGNKEKIIKTNLEKYGVEYPAQSLLVQKKMKKTSLDRYGVENIFQRTDMIKEKIKEKYGVEHIAQSKEIKEKIKRTNRERYGFDYCQQNPEVIKKRGETNLLKYGNICSLHSKETDKKMKEKRRKDFFIRLMHSDRLQELVTPLFKEEEYKGGMDDLGLPIYYKWKCNTCHNEFESHIANGTIPRCPICFPSSIQGKLEKELVAWLISILPDTKIITNTRRLISPLEIDIYIPSFNLAIEFDEVYWHSEKSSLGKRDQNYHINKTKACKEKGIHLLHIFDSEWWDTPDIVKSVIKTKLGLFERKIGARKCSIKKLSADESKEFLISNHLQGYAPASLRYGLFYNDELVSHLAIAKNRFKKNTYEIVRYASLLNTFVQGGLSKLWKEVEKEINKPYTLVSYVDKRYFSGKSNESLGLQFSHTNRPAYYYTKDFKKLHNRMIFQKKNIEKNLSIYDNNLTEWENMQLNGYDRIWDCGTDVWIKNS